MATPHTTKVKRAPKKPAKSKRGLRVSAMFGESLIDVQHLTPKKGSGVSCFTIVLLSVGFASLLLTSSSFFMAVETAESNAINRHHWTTELRRPEWRFEGQKNGFLYDWSTSASFILGLFSLTWGIGRLRNKPRSPFYSIGSNKNVNFTTQESSSESFTLIEPDGDDFVLNCSS